MTLSTRFDMASCTKALATTTAVALLYQKGQSRTFAFPRTLIPVCRHPLVCGGGAGLLQLDMPIVHPDLLGPDFAPNGRLALLACRCFFGLSCSASVAGRFS